MVGILSVVQGDFLLMKKALGSSGLALQQLEKPLRPAGRHRLTLGSGFHTIRNV
jgi:hypothetical protein